MTAGQEERERVIKRLNEQFAANEKLIGTRTRVLRLDFGPPIGFPVQFRVLGPDAEQLRRIAYQVRDKMREFEETREFIFPGMNNPNWFAWRLIKTALERWG